MKKNIWIIGSSSGIGREVALQYGIAGNNIAVSSRNSEKLHSLLDEINVKKEDFFSCDNLCLPLDVLDSAELQKSFNEIISRWKKIDMVIYATGVYQAMTLDQLDLDFAKKTVSVNFLAVFDVLKMIVPQMEKQGGGHLALIGSVAGYRGLPKSLAYGASKAAMINLAEGIYPELKKKNIAISVINPGFVKTRLTDANDFSMPALISAEKAAKFIIKGLKKRKFEIHFPLRFTIFMKILRIMPNFIYLKIIDKIER